MCDPPIDNGPDNVACEEAELLRESWYHEYLEMPEQPASYAAHLENKLEQSLLQAVARCDGRDALAERLARFTGRTVSQEVQTPAFAKPFTVEQRCENMLQVVDRNGKPICDIMSGDDLCDEDHIAAGMIVAALNSFDGDAGKDSP